MHEVEFIYWYKLSLKSKIAWNSPKKILYLCKAAYTSPSSYFIPSNALIDEIIYSEYFLLGPVCIVSGLFHVPRG